MRIAPTKSLGGCDISNLHPDERLRPHPVQHMYRLGSLVQNHMAPPLVIGVTASAT